MEIARTCPTPESERFLVRLLQEEDFDDLLNVYGDIRALPVLQQRYLRRGQLFLSDKGTHIGSNLVLENGL